MARNGSGVYSLPAADNPAVASTLIESTKFNNTMNDLATALTGSLAADGQTTVTANIPMNNNRITGLGAATLATDAAQLQQLTTNGTSQVTTSGTSIDFTGIPSWAKRIDVMFVGVSTNGSSSVLIQLGDAGGFETTGYLGADTSLQNAVAVAVTNYTTGFGISTSVGTIAHGKVTLSLAIASTFTWVADGTIASSDAAGVRVVAGSKSTSAALDRIRITTVNGTDAFDAGAVNILYS